MPFTHNTVGLASNPGLFSSVQSLSRVQLFVTPRTAARQVSLSITNSWSLPKPMSIESVMPSKHLILCHPLLLPLSIFPSIRVFSNESILPISWAKYWSFSLSISPSNEYSGLTSFRIDIGRICIYSIILISICLIVTVIYLGFILGFSLLDICLNLT